jgi:serine/threonine protein kinase
MVKSLSQSNLNRTVTICLHPGCLEPDNLAEALCCNACGSSLLLRDRYRAIQLLGQGGSGRTFLAIDVLQPALTHCVIKQFPVNQPFPRTGSNFQPGQPSELAKKLDLWRKLGHHLQLPAWLDGFEQAGSFYLIQDYIAGESLATAIAKNRKFNPEDIWQILASLLPVLQFIHAQGLVHGDLKPENIIDRFGSTTVRFDDLVLVDVGSAQILTDPVLTEIGVGQPQIGGSPEYAAPEQLEGQPTFASDLYSLGVICIHLLTGVQPFNLFEIANHRWVWQSYWLPEPSNAKADLENHQLTQFLDRLIATDLSQRFGSAAEAIAAFQKLNGRKIPIRVPVQSSWTCSATLTGHAGLFANVNAVAIAPDGSLIASASDDKTIRLWNLPTGKACGVLQGHTQFVRSVAFHPPVALCW